MNWPTGWSIPIRRASDETARCLAFGAARAGALRGGSGGNHDRRPARPRQDDGTHLEIRGSGRQESAIRPSGHYRSRLREAPARGGAGKRRLPSDRRVGRSRSYRGDGAARLQRLDVRLESGALGDGEPDLRYRRARLQNGYDRGAGKRLDREIGIDAERLGELPAVLGARDLGRPELLQMRRYELRIQ